MFRNRTAPSRERYLRKLTASAYLTMLVGASMPSCSWTRFDDATDNSPVLIFKASSGLNGLGTSVAAIRAGSTTMALATGSDGYAIYDFGSKNSPTTDAITVGHCLLSDGCHLAKTVAPVQRDVNGVSMACFAYSMTAQSDGTANVHLTCEKNLEFALALDGVTQTAVGKLSTSTTVPLRFASGPRIAPERLLVSARDKGTLWYYPNRTSAAVPITPTLNVAESFGATLAILDSRFDSADSGTTLVVGEPKAGRVHFFATDDTGAVTSQGCIAGPAGFGQMLASGYYLATDLQSIAVASASQVNVLPELSQLGMLQPNTDGCIKLEQLTNTLSLACKEFGIPVDCTNALSLGALATADLNGDQVDELLVGIATASAVGVHAAGQVLTVTAEPTKLAVRERLAPSSPESGDRLGESVVGIPLSRAEVVLAGAPGGNKLAAFYCSALVPDGQGGKRCE